MEKNPKVIDLLDEDSPLANQKFACISFLSPEIIIKQKNIFLFEHFVKQWDFKKSTEKYTHFLSFIAYKYNLNFDTLTEDLKDFVESEKNELLDSSILDNYKTYIENHEESLNEKFNKEVNFQTSTRGIKIRGVFPTQEEAELRCKLLREVDPHHDVYVGPVGLWMPWHPEAYKTGRVDYLEQELNNLMHEKKANEAKAKIEFDKRVRESKEKAIKENQQKAEETGNKLSQNIDEKGNLYNVNDVENEISLEKLKEELFDTTDVVVGNSDHGFSNLTENHPKTSESHEESDTHEEYETHEESKSHTDSESHEESKSHTDSENNEESESHKESEESETHEESEESKSPKGSKSPDTSEEIEESKTSTGSTDADGSPVKVFTTLDEFNDAAQGLMIVDFTATWCPPCKRIGPVFEKIAVENQGGSLVFVKIDVDVNQDAVEKASISCMPTFQVWSGGQKVDGFEGASETQLRALVEKYT